LSTRLSYRPDIDGLRAISAGSVVLFHAHVPGFGGGFVGVDVFFVISGYLITQVLLASADQPPRRWLAEFYLRRCRRVLPALLVLLLLVTPIAALVLMPADLRNYGRYLASTSVLLTNVAAWTDHNAGWPALVHLWTIAVEEQFYLVFPLLLLAVGRVRAVSPAIVIGGLAALSFALSVWASYAAPSASFYLTPPRVWELLLGSLLVLTRWQISSAIAREAAAIVSLLAIAVTVHVYSSRTPYAGLYALPVCLAAAALLATGRDQITLVARLLSVRPLVFTGLISYSLYLWHAAVFSLFWSWNRGSPDTLQTVILLATIWVLAVVSWRLVERPIRHRRWLKSNRRFFLTAAMLNLALGTAGFLLWKVLPMSAP
jgi:peptidoglycan/LPS O-acetylase OafA/YrhL